MSNQTHIRAGAGVRMDDNGGGNHADQHHAARRLRSGDGPQRVRPPCAHAPRHAPGWGPRWTPTADSPTGRGKMSTKTTIRAGVGARIDDNG